MEQFQVDILAVLSICPPTLLEHLWVSATHVQVSIAISFF